MGTLGRSSFMSDRTFIFHDGALGDLLLSIPALAALRAHSPHIHLAGRHNASALLAKEGYVDEFSDAGSVFYAGLFSASPDVEVGKFLRGFARAYVFSRGHTSPLPEAIGSVIRDTSVVLTVPPKGCVSHVSEFRLSQLGHGGSISSLMPKRPPSKDFLDSLPDSVSRFRRTTRGHPVIAIHPGSGSSRKNWPLERFLRVMGALAERGATLIVLSGPGEPQETTEKLQSFAMRQGSSTIFLREEPLPAVAAVLGMTDLYLGNDSGITHLASLVAPRVLALYGPTDPSIWGPVGGGQTIWHRWACTQCTEPERRCPHRACLLSISPELVLKAVSRLLGNLSQRPSACNP